MFIKEFVIDVYYARMLRGVYRRSGAPMSYWTSYKMVR